MDALERVMIGLIVLLIAGAVLSVATGHWLAAAGPLLVALAVATYLRPARRVLQARLRRLRH